MIGRENKPVDTGRSCLMFIHVQFKLLKSGWLQVRVDGSKCLQTTTRISGLDIMVASLTQCPLASWT